MADPHVISTLREKRALVAGLIEKLERKLEQHRADLTHIDGVLRLFQPDRGWPQAKGRIERAFGTLQDRMVKELRLAGVSSIAAANAWLPGFITAYNTRFGRDPANAKDLHRPLAQADDLDEILAWREERTVTRNLTLHYDRMMLILDPTPLARGLVRQKVEVVNYPDGRFAVQFTGTALGFKVFDKIQTVQPGAIVDNKRLSAVLELVKAQQAAYPARQQRG